MAALTPTQKKAVRASIADFCRRAEGHQLAWHYTQARPFHGFGVKPEGWHANDCSGYVSLVYNWASHEHAVYLADPLGERYSGWGYTGTELTWLRGNAKPAPEDKYLVGDIAVYGHPGSTGSHTVVCRQPGTAATAIWSSNGSEAAPNAVKLNYHPDPVMGVWRHPALL